MKTKSKALLLSLCAVLLVAATVLGTIAWLTAQDSVTNTFTVGNVKIELKEPRTDEFGEHYYKMAAGGTGKDEKVDADTLGAINNWDEYVTVTENSYTLRPGQEYAKMPTIILDDNSENCYYFVKIENDLADIEHETFQDEDNPQNFYSTIEDQMKLLGWFEVEGYTGVYALHGVEEDISPDGTDYKLSPERRVVGTERGIDTSEDKYVPIFTCFRVKDDVDGETLEALSGENDAQITITAYAVQADGFDAVTEEGTNAVSDAELWATAFPEAAKDTAESSDDVPTT